MSDINHEQSERLLRSSSEFDPPEDESAEKSFQIPVISNVRPRRRLYKACFVAWLLLLAGFGLCRYVLPNPGIPIFCHNCSPFDFSAFYGIPKDLPVIDGSTILNQTELDMKTGFIVSNVPTLREYTLNITQALTSPDGFQKPMILMNGQFPGPLIEANSGDTLRIHVNNLMSNWSTSVHWHGIDQKNSTWMV